MINPWTRKGTHPIRVSGIEKKEAVKNILKIMDTDEGEDVDEDDHGYSFYD